ncbi:MAG: phosphoribosylanthranilate isomerase [Lautropia sp.]|nr:phosphoribosylanthranilate isomerase [Lautropia sp.]
MKFCGLVRPQDVDAAVAIGVDAVGFVFYPGSPRYVTLDDAAALRRRLPSWVSAVGLFVNAPVADMAEGVRRVGLDVVQAHGEETPALLAGLDMPGVDVWKALRIGGCLADLGAAGQDPARLLATGRVPADPEALREALRLFGGVSACLLDSAGPGFGGSGHAFDWTLAGAQPGLCGPGRDTCPAGTPATCAGAGRLILAGGLRPETVGNAVRQVRPFAVDVSSGIQGTGPREKDMVRMEDFMAAILQADAALAAQ